MARTLILLLLVALFAGIALAEPLEARPRLVEIRGMITNVDLPNHQLILHTRRGDVTVVFDRRTRIMVDGQPARPIDLAVGQRARVIGRPDPPNHVFRARGIRARN